ncbi:hypothetical protein KBD61_00275 [Patescibacteria group bacterium]|nr:hypothetical protein [Patescibacteria group bacterium]MBP9709446.1 hypothetical protein [Patescibacteria group bacterium]
MNEKNPSWVSAPADNQGQEEESVERESVKEVWMTMDMGGGKASAPIRIWLTPTGEVDLSLVPEKTRLNWERFGVRDSRGGTAVKPDEGAAFLEMLISVESATYGPWFSR